MQILNLAQNDKSTARQFTRNGPSTTDQGRLWVFCLLLASCWLLAVRARGQSVTVTGQVALVSPRGRERVADNSSVAVWLTPISESPGAGGARTPVPSRRFRLLQERKRFEPHLIVVPVGSVVDFPNHDPFFHNVFSLFEGKRFDLGLYEAGGTHSVNFDRAGVCYIFCNIHPEMSAVVVVVETPYYGVSNRAGEITIPNVRAGRYQLGIWNERCLPEVLKKASREITITDGAPSLGRLVLAESASLIGGHKNLYGQDYANPDPASPLYGER